MKIQGDLVTITVCLLHLVNFPNVDTFLFRRKNVHQVVNDPYQVKKDNITTDNLFAWLNMKNHIKFKLWTRRNPKLAQDLRIGDLESISTSNFDSRRLTKIIVHGYAHSANEIYLEDWIVSLRDAYLNLADLNIIIIDYTLFALPAFYWTAGPDLAATQLTNMIKFLLENKQISLEGLHLLGFSWGAHISGNAAAALGGKIGRITGLDPALPTFRLVDDNRRLDKTDALFESFSFLMIIFVNLFLFSEGAQQSTRRRSALEADKKVDIIHTNSGRAFMEGHLGLGIPLGHADYYPNSGRAQPGCPLKWTYAYEEIECDHARSVNFFAESIVSPIAFPSCRCDNWDHYVRGECPCEPEDMVFMGEHSGHNVRGKFYLFTRDKKPFGLGSQMNISLPDIDQYDPDFNNTGYHNHLRPFSLEREPLSYSDTDISSLQLPPIKNSSNSNQIYSALLAPQLQPATQIYWEPLSTFVIKSGSNKEYPSYGSNGHSNRVQSYYLKRHSSNSKTPLTTPLPLFHQTKQRTMQTTPLLDKLKKQPYTRFATQLINKYIHGP